MFARELESRIQSAFNVSDIGKDLHFINRRCAINWIKVVSADINKVINEKDYGCLKENVLNIVNYDLDSVVTSKVLDPGFVKLFRLSQLTIEYLLYTLNYFQKRSKQLSEEKNIMKKELEKFLTSGKEVIGNSNGQPNSFNASDPRKEAHLVLVGNDSSNTFRCMLCGKTFLNGCYLYAHHQRRHSRIFYPSLVDMPTAPSSFPSKIPEKNNMMPDGETERIWKELEWLRKKVYESSNMDKPVHQEPSQHEVCIRSPQNLLPKGTRSSYSEKRNDDSSVRVEMGAGRAESDWVDDVKGSGDQVEKKSNGHQIPEVLSEQEKEEDICFEQDPKDACETKAEHTIRNRTEYFDSRAFSERASTLTHVEELQKPDAQKKAEKDDSGRLEAQERVWRGRLKALADKSSQEIEALREMISSLQEKESELEEEYREKIKKLTHQLKEQSLKPTVDKAVATVKEEEPVQAIPPINSVVEDIESPPSSRDATLTSLSPAKLPEGRESPMVSSASNASEVRSRPSDFEYDSSDISTSPKVTRRRLPSDHSSEDEESDPEMALEVFEKKLRHLNINPSAKSMPEKIFKEKMEMLNAERRILKRGIENYHHIKSNLEEKADARVSQKMLRLKLDKRKVVDEPSAFGSGHWSPKDAFSQEKMKESSISSQKSSATTSRSAISSHSQPSSGRTAVSQSSIKSVTQRSDEDLPYQSRISVMTERLKSSKGGIGESHGYSSVGANILRGLHQTRGEGEKVAAMPTFGGYGSKSVSFAHDLVVGKGYHAIAM
ncbi:cilium assembly protein DZIP1-like isoform X2 [Hetaerina americana]|uniref:cilium assembly protein DZIP1-like isoform X2 n=1 Tax=Hetaerina americana TaxID=62018 RepID=UPI003A7F6228